MKPIAHLDLTNSVADWQLLDDYEAALRDLLHFYDRVRGVAGHGEGWTAADVLRLEQIRSLIPAILSVRVPARDADAVRLSPNGHCRPPEARSGPNAPDRSSKGRKARKTRPNGS